MDTKLSLFSPLSLFLQYDILPDPKLRLHVLTRVTLIRINPD